MSTSITDEDWLLQRYITATDGEIEFFTERVAIMLENNHSQTYQQVQRARSMAMDCLMNYKRDK